MKKKILSVLLCLVMVSTLMVGCSKDGGSKQTDVKSTPAPSTAATKAPDNSGKGVTITYGLWDSNQAKLIQKIADDFEKESGIHVEIQVNGWTDYWTALEAAATGGSLPDTFWMHSNNINYYASNDQLLDLTSYIEKSGGNIDLKNYPEGLNKIYNLNGKQYAIPKDYDTIGLWYNKTMFDKAGVAYPTADWTWDDMKAAAKKLTTKDHKQYGVLAPLHGQEGYYNFVYQNGGTIVTADKKSGYDDPKTIEAMKYYFDLSKEGLSPKITNDAERQEAFQNGLTAMAFFGSWNLSGFAANEYIAKNCDVTILPKSNNGGRASIFNGLGNCIAANTKHPEESWKWIQYLSNEAGQKKQAELGIAISAFNGTSEAWTKAYPQFNVKCYLDMLSYAQIRPYTNQTSIWEDKAFELLTDAYTKDGDVDAACKNVAKMMNDAIAQEK